MVYFYTAWKSQKNSGFLTSSRGVEMEYSREGG